MERLNLFRALFGAMLVHFCVGSFFVYGNINGYVSAYFKQTDPSINDKTTMLIQPVWILF